jgi:hypothetical protein
MIPENKMSGSELNIPETKNILKRMNYLHFIRKWNNFSPQVKALAVA